MPDSEQLKVIYVALEIQRYLKNHPKAADTVKGITKWWLPQQGLEVSALLVQKALDYLISESIIERKLNIGTDDVYYIAQTKSKNNGKEKF